MPGWAAPSYARGVPTDDEFRRVAEDVRALARSLARDVRSAVDRAREEPADGQPRTDRVSAAGRAARDELRMARAALRQAARGRHDRGCGWSEPPGLSGRPRWDNWGRPRFSPPHSASAGTGTASTATIGQDRAERHAEPAARQPTPSLPLRHRHDGSTLLGLLAVVFGLAWLAAGTQLVDVSAEAVLAVALMVLGVALVITARTDWALSRRSWPVFAGALLLVALIVSSSSPTLASDIRHLQFGSRTITASSWTDLPATVEGGVGETVVDLSAIHDPLTAPRVLEVDGAIGNLMVRLPADLAATLDAHIGAGSIMVNRMNVASGFRPTYNRTLNPGATGPILTVRVRSGVGTVRVMAITASGTVPPVPKVPDVPLLPR
jgi:hypothetical protein